MYQRILAEAVNELKENGSQSCNRFMCLGMDIAL